MKNHRKLASFIAGRDLAKMYPNIERVYPASRLLGGFWVENAAHGVKLGTHSDLMQSRFAPVLRSLSKGA